MTDHTPRDLIQRLADYVESTQETYCVPTQNLIAETRAYLATTEPAAGPQPIPLTERLPGPEDCDAEGRCWWWYPARDGNAPTYGYWAHEDAATERARHEWPAAWLPHHALPLPETAHD